MSAFKTLNGFISSDREQKKKLSQSTRRLSLLTQRELPRRHFENRRGEGPGDEVALFARLPRHALLAARGFAYHAHALMTAHLCCVHLRVLPHGFSSKRESARILDITAPT